MPTRPGTPRIVIVGAGMSGLLMGMRLIADGIETFTILERADAVGGTWRDNTYPGLICDVPADLYSYVGRPNAEWSHRFARGPEIQHYLERIAAEAGLRRFIRFGTEVVGAAFRDGEWQVETADGATITAGILISACGFLRRPRYPAIDGLDSFAGAMFHSARWDHRVALAGARVGIIGTGSTGVQIVPAIVGAVGKLSLFQRTAPWLLPFPDHQYRPFEKALTRRIPALSRMAHGVFGLMFEWTFARAVIGNRLLQGGFQLLCQRNLDRNVKDPALRARLQPDYRAGCKRLMFSSAFYPAIQRPNAELVDTPIERVTPAGIVTADGREHRLDVLILATGFDAHAYMQPMRVAGTDGRTIAEAWREGVHAYRTVAMPGFPNFFMLVGPGSPVGNFSIIPIAEIQADYIMQAVRRIAGGKIATLQPTETATTRFNQAFRRATQGTVWLTGCRNWYLDRNGVPDVWPWTIARFRAELRSPDLADFEVTPGGAVQQPMNERTAPAAAASWQSRILQSAMRRLIAPRFSLAHGVAPFRRTLGLLAAAPPCPPPRGFARWSARLGGVPGEWLRRGDRQTADAPVLLHFHGGGFVAGTPRLGRRIVARIAARTGSDAFSVDYRLAPENPFPAALDDAVACYRALVADGIVPGRIVLAGESAGAALALGLAIRIATDRSPGPGPAALVLLSPWLDLTLTGSSLAANDDPGLPGDLLVAARRLYKPDERYADPLASPLFGPLAGLPPTLIQVGTREILLDDARRLAVRLGEAGVDRRLEEWGGMHHAWHLAPGVVPEVAGAFDAIARFIAGR